MSSPRLTPIEVTIKVHPEHIKKFPDPNGKGRNRYIAQVSVDEIARASIEFGPNPRNQNLETKVSQAIAEGLTVRRGWFMYFNRGIVLNAESAEYDNKTQEFKLKLLCDNKNPWESVYGNLDGGHTNKVILKAIKDGWKNFAAVGDKQFVTLEVLLGIEEGMLSDLVGARNTNISVKDLSIIVLKGDIDWLQNILEKHKVNDKIGWRQFENGEVNGIDVIATLSLLNPNLEVKTRCYNGPGRIISELKSDSSVMKGLRSIQDIAFEYLRFVDYIHASFENWYKQAERNKRVSGFGNLSGISMSETELIFLKKTIRYKILKSWLLPLAFSFTRVVKDSPDDPQLWRKVADKVGPQLYAMLREQTSSFGFNLDKLAKSSAVWNALEALVWAEYMTQKLANV